MCNFYNAKENHLDPGCIEIEMTRSLPINRTELVDMVASLEGVVSDETRLSLLDFIDDPKEELKKLKEQLKEKTQMNAKQYGSYEFKQGNDIDGEEEEQSVLD